MPTPLRTLRRSHQQTTPMPNSPFRAEESPNMPQKHLILIISRPTFAKFYCLYMHLLIPPHRIPKLLSSQCNCNGSWPFSLHAPDGALFQLPDRRHTVKQRSLPLTWSSLKFYPLTPSKLTGYVSLNPCKT